MSLTEYKVEAKVFVIDKTDVSIKKEYPYTFIRRSLPGDWTDKSDEAVINAVVEIVNTEFDPTSAIAKLTLLQNEVKQTIEHTKKNSEIGQKALLELAGQVTEVVTDIEVLKAAVFGEGHENEEEHSTDAAPTAPSTTPVAPTVPTVAPVTPTTPEVTPQPTAPVATESTSTVPETTAQPVAPQPVVTAPTTNINMEVEHHESTETSIPQGQSTGVPSENTTSTITSVQ
jgi:hypothetical protein